MRTERKSREKGREIADFVGAAETSGELEEWRSRQKKLEHTVPAEKERVASVTQSENLPLSFLFLFPKGYLFLYQHLLSKLILRALLRINSYCNAT